MAERQQRLGPQSRRQYDERHDRYQGLLRAATDARSSLAAPEVELVDLEDVDERQRAAHEEERENRGVVGRGPEELELADEAARGRDARHAEGAEREHRADDRAAHLDRE